eukprot:PhM_4_TR15996/c0_g1_i1/m.93848/K10583/UBE2S, E2EPF; ubiquitin-conjugating enzyme E2 S
MLSAAATRAICRDLSELASKPIDGITIRPNENNLSLLEADIMGPEDTPYYGGLFIVRLVFDSDYPTAPPKGYFMTKILHPNVSEKGEICVNTLKKDWTSNIGLRHVFLVIRCLMVEPNPESALHEEAARLLLENYEEFAIRAKMFTQVHATAHTNSCSSVSGALKPSRMENKENTVPGEKLDSAPVVPAVKSEKKKALKRL